ncbi:carboxypeptidase-like regulatory domain-containing protein [Mucilaginibacter achroorhodeus]|uniref:Carboxypeptidase-like regulatory domain-containing protein n=1 Tax=Mucilaginibacter achroorhodeus TaxID=2599294 RepID=A0A563U1T9_9SPHI|nr:carboxypeptidase-like regulatory domain-containing protein [Mucilaginibacter achroorhodeus]TWR25410.1 carboxypeptidase-like regulatory domain-containing protein [Mucilaginibacter achroorhodeus]
MKRILLIVLLIVPAFFAKAQELTGKVIDGKTQAPLQYVNVGVMGKSIGTVTGKDGSFNLNLSDHPNDTLRLSMVGYVPLTFKIADAINMRDKNFVLQPATMQLNEVKVSNHKWKQVILGNTTRSKNTNASFNTGRPGNEIGTIIKIKKSPTYLKQFNASLSSTLMTDSVTMRLNFYTIKNGLPNQLLQNQNIFVTIKKGQDMITADLNPYNIVVEDKFFVSLEWVKESRAENIWFSASLFSGAIIARETSQGTWEKEGIVGLGFNVLAEY